MAKLTPFGKAVRKHRIEIGVRLKDMADTLGVSSAYISSIEVGKKSPSAALVDQIAEYLNLGETDNRKLHKLANEARTGVMLNLKGVSKQRRELAAAFSRKFNELSVSEVEDLMKVLKREGGG